MTQVRPFLQPQTLKAGCYPCGTWIDADMLLTHISDQAARYAFCVKDDDSGYYVIDGFRSRKFAGIEPIQFSDDGLGYCFNTADALGGVINGVQPFQERTKNLIIHGDTSKWTFWRKGEENLWRIVTPQRTYATPIMGYTQYSPDGKMLFYLDPFGNLIGNDQVIFPGGGDFQLAQPYPYACWVGGKDEADHIYMLGQPVEKLSRYYLSDTFAVAPLANAYLYGASMIEHDFPPAQNKDKFVCVNGDQECGPFREITKAEQSFSKDGKKWVCYVRDHNGSHGPLMNGKMLGRYAHCAGFRFSEDGTRYGYIAYTDPGSPDEMERCGYPLESNALVVIDGKREDPQAHVEKYSFGFSPDSRHYAYIAQGNEEKGHRIYLDGEVLDESDYICGMEGSETAHPVFSEDSTRIYYFSLIDDLLYFNVHETSP